MANPPNNPQGRHSTRSPLKQPCYARLRPEKPRFARFFLFWLNPSSAFSAATRGRLLMLRHRCLPERLQMPRDLLVALVHVGNEGDRTGRIEIGGLIDHKNRYRRGQHVAVGRDLRDPLVDLRDRLLQQKGAKLPRVLDANAAMASAAIAAGKQMLLRRVVQVDVESVGHLEFELAQGA